LDINYLNLSYRRDIHPGDAGPETGRRCADAAPGCMRSRRRPEGHGRQRAAGDDPSEPIPYTRVRGRARARSLPGTRGRLDL